MVTPKDRAQKLAEKMACEATNEYDFAGEPLATREEMAEPLLPYAAALVQAEEALSDAGDMLATWDALKHDHDDGRVYGDCDRCTWDETKVEVAAALAAIRSLDHKTEGIE